jgi:hypothetical protein
LLGAAALDLFARIAQVNEIGHPKSRRSLD